MYSKKFVFSLATIPVAVFTNSAYEWQQRRAREKIIEGGRREELLEKEPVDITPGDDGKFMWRGVSDEDVEKDWNFVPVKIKGQFDFKNERMVLKHRVNERGFEIITPLVTHVNEKGEKCGVLVNRGYISHDLQSTGVNLDDEQRGEVEGVLYLGDNLTKYHDNDNAPIADMYNWVDPRPLSIVSALRNREDSSRVMLKLVDFDENKKRLHPCPPVKNDFTKW